MSTAFFHISLASTGGWPFWRSFRSFFVKRITYAGPAVKSPFEPAQHRQSADGYT
ncbi:hypothetical protein B4114_1753 [Geobacillus stearothermophilus]|uniref:Uncharacterized protein n=1 Tax=Geobacillus stearothermophilus TaxID=1422 RepID=A0A150NBT6_GEOSE|nr:hypothetical protein B4114_1753 [Geobacillus stearothermophilus]